MVSSINRREKRFITNDETGWSEVSAKDRMAAIVENHNRPPEPAPLNIC